jgi:2-oxoglutarate ferredoxin oxidoreductase subunit gamma
VERALMLTGVGGQSIQLGAQILARAAVIEARQVTYLGTYGGTMRGGSTEATLIVGDAPISAPPIVSKLDAALAMHHAYWPPVAEKLRDGAVVLCNAGLFEGEIDRARHRVFEVPATSTATELGAPLAACLVLVGAFAAITGLVGIDALCEGMRDSVPSYRRQHVEANEKALWAGFDTGPEGVAPLWKPAS